MCALSISEREQVEFQNGNIRDSKEFEDCSARRKVAPVPFCVIHIDETRLGDKMPCQYKFDRKHSGRNIFNPRCRL